MSDTDKNYEVGFAKPPRESMFKKGQSGNPSGRPRGKKNLATIFHQVWNEKVRIKDKNGYREVTKLEAMITQLANKGLSGDPKAVRELIRLFQLIPEPPTPVSPPRAIQIIWVEPDHKPTPTSREVGANSVAEKKEHVLATCNTDEN